MTRLPAQLTDTHQRITAQSGMRFRTERAFYHPILSPCFNCFSSIIDCRLMIANWILVIHWLMKWTDRIPKLETALTQSDFPFRNSSTITTGGVRLRPTASTLTSWPSVDQLRLAITYRYYSTSCSTITTIIWDLTSEVGDLLRINYIQYEFHLSLVDK